MNTLINVSLALIFIYVSKRLFSTRRPAPYPPGPTALPIIGNLHQYPKTAAWRTFNDWADKYGDLVMVKTLGRRILVINSPKLAVEMFEKKSGIYSDRPIFTMAGELSGWTRGMALTQYGDRLREMRKILHTVLSGRSNLTMLVPVQEIETRRFLLRVLTNAGANLGPDLRRLMSGIMLKIAYGYSVSDAEGVDPYVKLIETAMSDVIRAVAPGAYMVDVLPILRHIPAWFPGAGFKRDAQVFRDNLHAALEEPFEFTKQQMAAGTAFPSLSSQELEAGTPEDIVKTVAFQIYAGGSDTTISSIEFFFLAMVLHPEIQATAQQELDRVVGRDGLPTLGERAQLPYINAIVKEVLRWVPVAPQGQVHCVTEDDVQEGYFIPKGTLCLANIWKFLHDPHTYKDPDAFNPARFVATELTPAEQDPLAFAFGFGRRICPGIRLADTSLFLAVAMTLAVFHILPAVDEKGNTVPPPVKYTTGIALHPLPFECKVKIRDERAMHLVKSVEGDLDKRM